MGQGFFDVHAKLQQPRVRSAAPTLAGTGEMLTVSQLTTQIDRALKGGVPAQVIVKGEVSNYKAHGPSGNLYFTLKDDNACIDCAMFRSDAVSLRFRPEDGMELLATGRVGVYPQRGKYQLYVAALTPVGKGALELALQQLRAKLEKEGLFAAERKRPLPLYPLRITLVTSRETAAFADMLKVLSRFPWLRVSLFHVPVQGDGSAEKIAEALKTLNQNHRAVGTEVIILGRGGGSLEDLWEFNEEVVARAIDASEIPVVTGIGHEIDTSIADLCADYFAHTPTEAAQVITAGWRIVPDLLDSSGIRLRRGIASALQQAGQRLNAVERHEFFRRPMDRIGQLRQLLDDRQRSLALQVGRQVRTADRRLAKLSERLQQHRPKEVLARNHRRLEDLRQAMISGLMQKISRARDRWQQLALRAGEMHPRHRLRLLNQQANALEERFLGAARRDILRRQGLLAAIEGRLNALSPESAFRRGYTMTTLKKTGAIVRDAETLKAGDRIVTRFARGTTVSVVDDAKQLPLFE